MTEAPQTPSYMSQLLDALGWNRGTRIPLADTKNQELENDLINRYELYSIISFPVWHEKF